jgi:hypothetical protein
LVYPGTASIGNKARFELKEENKQIRIDRNLANPIKNDGKTYWISFLMNTDSMASKNQVAQVTLKSSSITNNDGQVLTFGRTYGTGILGIVQPQVSVVSVSTRSDKGLNYIVARIKTSGNTALDTVHMWINPPLGSEPDTAKADIKARTTTAIKQGVDILRIRVEGAGADQIPYTTEFDEIRIASSWSSVRLTTNTIVPLLEDGFKMAAYPNPAHTMINFDFNIDQSKFISLNMYDVKGRLVKVISNESKDAGQHTIQTDISQMENGIYFVRLTDGAYSTVRKVIIYK